MTTFTLDDWSPAVPVILADGLTEKRLREFPAFQEWLKTLKSSIDQQKFSDHAFSDAPYRLRSIDVKSFYQTPGEKPRLLFVRKLAA